jgi:hypothetical protein
LRWQWLIAPSEHHPALKIRVALKLARIQNKWVAGSKPRQGRPLGSAIRTASASSSSRVRFYDQHEANGRSLDGMRSDSSFGEDLESLERPNRLMTEDFRRVASRARRDDESYC